MDKPKQKEKENEKEKETRSLYEEALERFRRDASERHSSAKDAELLNEFLRERATPEETKQAAELLQGDAGKKYGGRKVGDVEIPASWIANIMENIEHFVAAGDFVTKNAPESVGMAWYAIKLTLTAIHTNYDLYTFFGSGLSDISEIMVIVRHYDRLYDERSKPYWKPNPSVEQLFQNVIGAYAAVLEFSYAVKRHLTAGALGRIKHGFKDFFGLSKAKFEDKLNAVATFKQKILEGSQGIFQDKTLSQLESVSSVLAGIEGTVRHIRDFQDTQRKLHEEAMAKFDVLLKGLDDIKASTKRKSRWDYALQDFQTYQEALSPMQGSFKILEDTIDATFPGTCQWVFELETYNRWAEAEGSALLCLAGPEGSGKSFVVATIADHITAAAGPDEALLYVSCSGSTSSAELRNNQVYTADSVCRTLLSQLYDLAVQGEDRVELLENCNAIFRKAKAKSNVISALMRSGSDSLPEFADGFARIAALIKKKVVLVFDGVDTNCLDNKNQEDLARKIDSLMSAMSEKAGIGIRILIGCASSSKLFHELNPDSDELIGVDFYNRGDIEMVLTDALKDVPGLSAAEQETAKEAIMKKAGSRFLYVRDTAIPFMREPFQRPLSKRLEALPDGTSDVYGKALSKMSSNYLDLLRTALTWTVFSSPEFPGWPRAKEVVDFFQGTYDDPEARDAADDEGDEEGFPEITPLELDQLRTATNPFLNVWQDSDGEYWLFETDEAAVHEYFVRSGDDIPAEEESHEHFCARCGSTASASKRLYIDPKQSHLQMALTCLRHLNNPLFQRRAGLISAADEDTDDEDGGDEDGGDEGAGEDEAGDEGAGEDNPKRRPTVDETMQMVEDGYTTEISLDDEDIVEKTFLDRGPDEAETPPEADNDDGPDRIRYELQYWHWHLSQAESLWPAEERETNANWAALMAELDKFAFETPEVFAAWQSEYPEEEDEYKAFRLDAGPHKPLHVAAYLGLVSWTKHLLDRGEELNEQSKGYSPLQAAACSRRSIGTLRLLLDAGADPNAENGTDRNAFHLWLLLGDKSVEGARMFLDHGADPLRACSRMHYSPIQYFAFRGEDPEVLDLLMAAGADINAVYPEDPWKLSALHILLARREVPPTLLEAFVVKHKADTNWENVFSARPMQILCSNGQLELLRILLQSEILEIDDTDLQGTTAVHEASLYGYNKCVEALLEHGADPDIADKLKRTALHTAARKGHTETVRVLLRFTKQPSLLDRQSWSPLFCACLSKDEESALLILDALIESEVPLSEINLSTRSGRTVLRQAANHGFIRVVSKLIQLATDRSDTAGLLLDARDTKKGMTALHRAASNGHAACVRALLAAGADPTLLDNQSRPALALAYEQWTVANKNEAYEDILAQLIAAAPAAAVADADLVAVCAANGSVRLLEQLWRLNADLNRPDRYGWTPLALARQFARAEAEGFLKRQPAWTNVLPRRWETRFPGATAAGAASVLEGGKEILHTSKKRVCVSTDRPLPDGLESYYFEITLKEVPDREVKTKWPEVAIGFCTLGGAAVSFPGWWEGTDSPTTAESWGYHSDTGRMYSSTVDPGDDFTIKKQRYRVGDTVGAGVDLAKGEIWFTRNGVRLKEVLTGVEGRLFPVVGLHEEVFFETNFGREGDGEFKWKPDAAAQTGEEEEEEEKKTKNWTVVEVVQVTSIDGDQIVGEKQAAAV
ncbi:ankyrin repeat-containing domain protein [Thermothelomyces heterothallicus CBS 202.75]|uniref:ankyrin repeat-containing domain protein n=1 Tax=Thermothelomyces heterothallicus CBS 202.75 TaxID=1149848 RepID=UPI0037420527